MIKTWIYRHYKGNEYQVIWLACHSETEEKLVLYKSLVDKLHMEEIYWLRPYLVRPYEMFFETVEREWQTVPRFEWVRDK